MAWLELKVETVSSGIEAAAAALTAGGFADLVLEDQAEFENFLEDNKAYWDYIDEDLQQKLQDFPASSCIWKTPTRPAWPGSRGCWSS